MAVKVFLLFVALTLLHQPANSETRDSPSKVLIDADSEIQGQSESDKLERSEKNASVSKEDKYKGTANQNTETESQTPAAYPVDDYYYDDEEDKWEKVYRTTTKAESTISQQKQDDETSLVVQEGGITDVNPQIDSISNQHNSNFEKERNITNNKNDSRGVHDMADLNLSAEDPYEYAYDTEPNLSVPGSVSEEEPKGDSLNEGDETKVFDFGRDKGTDTETDNLKSNSEIVTTTLPGTFVSKLLTDANKTQDIPVLDSAVTIYDEVPMTDKTKEELPLTVQENLTESTNQSPKAEVDTSDEGSKFDKDDDANGENDYEDVDGADDISPAQVADNSHDLFESNDDDYKGSDGIGVTDTNDDDSYYLVDKEEEAEDKAQLPVTTSSLWPDLDLEQDDQNNFKDNDDDYGYDFEGDEDAFDRLLARIPGADRKESQENSEDVDINTLGDQDKNTIDENNYLFDQIEGKETLADGQDTETGIEDQDLQTLKQPQAPKSTIILYTALIILLIAGIVVITIWKGPFKILRRRSSSSVHLILQGDDDKKRLIV